MASVACKAIVHYFEPRQATEEAFRAASVGHMVVVLPQVEEEPEDSHFDSASKAIAGPMAGL